MKAFSLRSAIRQRCPCSSLLFNIISEVLATAIRKKKKKEKIPNWKEVKLSLFVDDMMLNIGNPKHATGKLELINEFGKVSGYEINIQKSVAFLYTNNEI